MSGCLYSIRSGSLSVAGRFLVSVFALVLLVASSGIAWGQGYQADGRVEVYAEYQGVEQRVQVVSFAARVHRQDWQFTITYPVNGAVDTQAAVGGRGFIASGTTNGVNVAGGTSRKLDMHLEAAPEAGRFLFYALIGSPDVQASFPTNAAEWAPFVEPRSPAMLVFDRKSEHLPDYPYLPARVEWTLNADKLRDLNPQLVADYFGNARTGRRKLAEYAKTQGRSSVYKVGRLLTTNGMTLPLEAALVHTYLDRNGKSGTRRFELHVENAGPLGNLDFTPKLKPGSRVSHVVADQEYVYASRDGTWLSDGEAKRVGTKAIRKSPWQSESGDSVGHRHLPLLVLLVTALMVFGLWLLLRKRSTKISA